MVAIKYFFKPEVFGAPTTASQMDGFLFFMYHKNFDLVDLEGEIWMPIPNFEGYYAVSNMGRVKGLDRTITEHHKNRTQNRFIPSAIIRQAINSRGYLQCALNKFYKSTPKRVNRLVCEAFHPKVEEKPHVNHKNGIKTDNRDVNLEWCSISENIKHSYEVLGRKAWVSKNKKGENIFETKKILCVTTGQTFNSQKDACMSLGVDSGSVTRVCQGKIKHTKGLVFKYI